ncbi:hypothetical protein [Nguyenibacter sp. L1]|uniref:hypothetical protein n=1 Tax=Nguyenibacter sp. L1 TaxID=3049350 RepID=UPI002B4767E1|nr:hypothetical protein [Nguyenibacter sp. L1]WRH86787.1 hypothetical protein QN315_12280 [Nguyenibacter sp. L1]
MTTPMSVIPSKPCCARQAKFSVRLGHYNDLDFEHKPVKFDDMVSIFLAWFLADRPCCCGCEAVVPALVFKTLV